MTRDALAADASRALARPQPLPPSTRPGSEAPPAVAPSQVLIGDAFTPSTPFHLTPLGNLDATLAKPQTTVSTAYTAVAAPGQVSTLAQKVGEVRTVVAPTSAPAPASASAASPSATAVPGVTRTVGALGVATGGIQAVRGVDQLGDGKLAEGSANVVLGSGSVAVGALTIAGSKAAAPVAAAVGIAGGAHQLLTAKDTEAKVLGGVKIAGGGVMVAGLLATAKRVRGPVGAALIAAGTAISIGTALFENRALIAKGFDKAEAFFKRLFA